MGYFYSVVAVIAFTILGISYKLTDRLGCDRQQVNFFLFLFALIIVFVWALALGKLLPVGPAIGLGSAMGVLTLVGVTMFRLAVARGRISTSWTVINLALVIPVFASIYLWREIPEPRHWVGVGLTVLAIALIGVDISRAGE